MNRDVARGYVSAIAACYLLLCSASCMRYALLHLGSDAATVPVMGQVLCLGMAVSAGLYFVKPPPA
jgi:hypothetical protein